MTHNSRFLGRAHWLVDLFILCGVALFFAGAIFYPRAWPPVLSRIFVDAGAAIAVSGVIAHFIS